MLNQTRIDEVYTDQETGYSWISLEDTKYGGCCGFGSAHCHPDDDFSYYFGCELAEIRAEIDVLKGRKSLLKEDIKTIRNFIKAMSCDKRFDNDSSTAKAMWRQWNVMLKQEKQIDIEIEHRQRKIKDMCRQRDAIIKRFNAQKEVTN